MRASFVIAANEERKVGSYSGAAVVFMEVADGLVFDRHRHGVQVVCVADCLRLSEWKRICGVVLTDLEIAANDEEIDTIPAIDFAGLLDGSIDSVECAMGL